MTKAEFRDSLHMGLGRAILCVRNNDVSAFRDVILDACLHCYAVDVQSEDTRSRYTMELLRQLPDRDFYNAKILESLAMASEDWDAVHRFSLAARRGQ